MEHYKHIIKKQVVNINMPVSGHTAEISTKIGWLCKNTLASLLDQACTVRAIQNQHISIDKIKLDIGKIHPDKLEAEFPEKLKDTFQKALDSVIPATHTKQTPATTPRATVQNTKVELLKHYLLTGTLPRWVSTPPAIAGIIDEIIQDHPEKFRNIIQTLAKKEATRKRLIYQLTDQKLQAAIKPERTPGEPRYTLLLELAPKLHNKKISPRQLREIIWDEVLMNFSKNKPIETPEFFKRLVHTLASSTHTTPRQLIKQLIRQAKNQNHPYQTVEKLKTLDTKEETAENKAKTRKSIPEKRKENTKNIQKNPKNKALQETIKPVEKRKPKKENEKNQKTRKHDYKNTPFPASEKTQGRPAADHIRLSGNAAANPATAGPASREKTEGRPSAEDIRSSGNAAANPAIAGPASRETTQGCPSADDIRLSGNAAANPAIAGPASRETTQGDPADDHTRLSGNAAANSAIADLTIRNAGLVLIWPFLEGYFQALELTQNNAFTHNEAACKAIHIIQYIATRKEQCPEYELALNKLICGIPIEEPVPADITLTTQEKKSARELVESMIKNWTAVKNSSVESITETYLSREGELIQKDNGWLLTIEYRTWDILLNKLPWGFGMIKLPWMKTMIHVDWS